MQEEKVVDTIGSLSKCCQTCQEIAISEIALFDVLWFWLSFEDDSFWILLKDLDPFDVLPFLHWPPFSTQRVDIGRETVIQKLLSLFLELFELFFGRTGLDLSDLLLDELDDIEGIS